MTTMTAGPIQDVPSDRAGGTGRPLAASTTRAARPALFTALLAVASVIVLGVLMAGPAIPVALTIAASLVALAIVVTSWVVAGPRA